MHLTLLVCADFKNDVLGIPTVSDRVAQGVLKIMLEPRLEAIFHDNSYGYRPKRGCHDAIAVTRKRCWQYSWVVEYDIKGLFDNIPHELLMKAVQKHVPEKWACLYIERWLKAAIVTPDGDIVARNAGTPQGGVLSPLLTNLFMHYATDLWMDREFQDLPWVRYSDDGLIHCKTKKQAMLVKDKLKARLETVGLTMHPEKTKIVQCTDSRREVEPGEHELSFVFLGFEFAKRPSVTKESKNKQFMGFLPAIGADRLKELKRKVKNMSVFRAIFIELGDLAKEVNPVIRGWLQYYGKFYSSRLKILTKYINERIMIWIKKRYKRSKKGQTRARAYRYLRKIYNANPKLFAHWGDALVTF